MEPETAPQSGIWPVSCTGVSYEAGGARRVDDVSLTLTPGPITAIMGPNGAGKSLLLRILAGLIRPTSGHVTYGGESGARPGEIAVVFQKPVLLRRSVAGNLMHALKTHGVPRGERRRRLEELLALGDLEALANSPARVTSGGEQQRLAMVRALAARPRLLLLDEPTASLDPHATAAIEALMARAVANGAKVVLVTHDLGQARRVSGDVVFMHRGRIVEQDATDQFLKNPASPEARAFQAGRLLLQEPESARPPHH